MALIHGFEISQPVNGRFDDLMIDLFLPGSVLALIPVPDMFVTPPHWVGGELFFLKFVEVEDLDRTPVRLVWVEDASSAPSAARPSSPLPPDRSP